VTGGTDDELVPLTSTSLTLRPGHLARAEGETRSTSEIAFDAPALRWGDLPAETRRAARHSAPVVADLAVTDDSLYDDAGALVQVMRAWRAHRDRLYLAVASRPVELGARSVRPAGPWQTQALHRWDVSGAPRRRVGSVAPGADPREAAGPAGAGGSPAPRPHRPEHGAAARTWPYLPAAVRASAERAVPLPQDWLGDLLQRSLGRVPYSQTLTVLRRDDERALVVRAHRALAGSQGRTAEAQSEVLAAQDWQVEQVVLPIARPLQLDATREEPVWF
jgi:hypothetical protein